MSKNGGWIGVDFDGTLAQYAGWGGTQDIGAPVGPMLARVKGWLAEGIEVRIFTPRVGPQKDVNDTIRAREAIEKWCVAHIGQVLPVTATKDFAMRELWDDRAVQVVPNKGIPVQSIADDAARVLGLLQDPERDEGELQKAAEDFNRLLSFAT